MDFTFVPVLADNFAVAPKQAYKGLGFVEVEGAADAAVADFIVVEDDLDTAA